MTRRQFGILAALGALAVGCAGVLAGIAIWATASITLDVPPRGALLLAPPDPERSVAVVPITIPLSELGSRIESSLPTPLVDQQGTEVRDGVRMDLKATLDGHVTASGHEGKLVYRLPISVNGRVYLGKRADKRGARGKDAPEGVKFEADLTMEAAVVPTLDEDWGLHTRTKVTHSWRGTPTVTVAGLTFGVEALADQAMKREIGRAHV